MCIRWSYCSPQTIGPVRSSRAQVDLVPWTYPSESGNGSSLVVSYSRSSYLPGKLRRVEPSFEVEISVTPSPTSWLTTTTPWSLTIIFVSSLKSITRKRKRTILHSLSSLPSRVGRGFFWPTHHVKLSMQWLFTHLPDQSILPPISPSGMMVVLPKLLSFSRWLSPSPFSLVLSFFSWPPLSYTSPSCATSKVIWKSIAVTKLINESPNWWSVRIANVWRRRLLLCVRRPWAITLILRIKRDISKLRHCLSRHYLK